jgi:hypothetical protein
VGDGVGAGLISDLNQSLGNQRTGDGGAEQVLALVDRVGPEHGEDVVAGELFAQVLNVDFLNAEGLGLFPRGFDFLTLANIGRKGDDLTVVGFLKPFDDYRGVESALVGQDDLVDV